MKDKSIDWEELLNFNDDKSDNQNIDLIDLEINKNDKQLSIYQNDYQKLVSIETILKNKSYYQTKYLIITKHLINMDDYYLSLEKKMDETFGNSNRANSMNSSQNSNKSKKISKTKEDLNILKLGYTKKLLEIYENEKMTGKEFEEYAKRTLYLMFLMIKKDNYIIYNPKSVNLKGLDQYLMSYEKNKKFNIERCEIDIIINDFQKADFNELINNYPKNFYFTEELHLDKIGNKFNIIGEIARNLIYQSDKKKSQINNYLDIFKKFKIIRENINKKSKEDNNIFGNNDNSEKNDTDNKNVHDYSESQNDEIITFEKKEGYEKIDKNQNLQKILNSFNIKDISKENIFLIITNGPYLLFKIIFEILEKVLKDENQNIYDIENKIEEHNDILTKLCESKRNLKEKVKNLYSLFKDLRKENINHCVLYIGTNSENLKDTDFFKMNSIITNSENKEELKENINEFTDIIRLKNGIIDMLKIKNEIDNKFESFANNVYQKLKDAQSLFKMNLKNSYKIKLNIYLMEDEKFETNSDYFIINTQIIKKLNEKFISDLAKKGDKMAIHLILLSRKYFDIYSIYTYDNILIFLKENIDINKVLISRFSIVGDVYKRYLENDFLQKFNSKITKINSYLSSISKFTDTSDLLNNINKELKPEFEIEEDSFKKALKTIEVNTEINEDLISKIIKNIQKTCNNGLLSKNNLENKIRQNVTQLEENIKMNFFSRYFINYILFEECEQSMIKKFKNINDKNLMI